MTTTAAVEFVTEFVQNLTAQVEKGVYLGAAEAGEQVAFVAAGKRITSGLKEHGEAAFAETEKLLSVVAEFAFEGTLFPVYLTDDEKQGFLDALEVAGSTCHQVVH